jgi:hypothetical protein
MNVAAAQTLSASLAQSSLKELYLRRNHITDDCAFVIAEGIKASNLYMADLTENDIGVESACVLVNASRKLHKLKIGKNWSFRRVFIDFLMDVNGTGLKLHIEGLSALKASKI